MLHVFKVIMRSLLSVLHVALHGCVEAVEMMMERCGYQTDQQDSCGSTPLMDALRAGYVDVARILIGKHKVPPSMRYSCLGS